MKASKKRRPRPPGAAGGERAKIRLGKGTTAVLRGEDDPRTWDMEELRRGRRRDANGRFDGPGPAVVPTRVLKEFMRRVNDNTWHLMAGTGEAAMRYLRRIVEDESAPMAIRVRVAQDLLDRLGVREAEQLTVEVHEPWKELIASAIVATRRQLEDPDEPEGEIIDAEVVEDDDEDDIVWDDEPEPAPSPPAIVRPSRSEPHHTAPPNVDVGHEVFYGPRDRPPGPARSDRARISR